MLVVHPKDRTTSVLSTLYEGMDANMVSSNCSNKKTLCGDKCTNGC